jgi:FkbM family methyltransferase
VRRNSFGNVTVHAVAVSDRSGEVELMQGRHPGGATIAEADRPRDHRRSIVVPSVTVDDLVAGGTAPPDFVKIDVEGAEAAVLGGMGTTLRRHSPVVLCELDDPTDDGIAAKVERVRTVLDGHGYGIEQLDPSYEGSRSQVVHLLARPSSA